MKKHPICSFLEKCEKCGYLHDTRIKSSSPIISKLNSVYTENTVNVHHLIRSKL